MDGDMGPSPGEGRAYYLALRCASESGRDRRQWHSEWHQNLTHALAVFQRATEPFAGEKPLSRLARTLHAEFDIDSVITFSDAWNYWESLQAFLYGAPAPAP